MIHSGRTMMNSMRMKSTIKKTIYQSDYYLFYIHIHMTPNALFISIWVIAFILLWAIVSYNGIIWAINGAKETKSSIDVMLKNRFDLLPNLVATVKQYMWHEADTLEKLTSLRTWSNDVELDGQVSSALKNLLAVAENYPDLKASTNFNTLQLQIEGIEDRLQAARRTYNAAVKHLMDKTMMFPGSLIASTMTIPAFPMFEAMETEKENPQVWDLFAK